MSEIELLGCDRFTEMKAGPKFVFPRRENVRLHLFYSETRSERRGLKPWSNSMRLQLL